MDFWLKSPVHLNGGLVSLTLGIGYTIIESMEGKWEDKIKLEGFITLHEATSYCNHSQDYLNLLVRKNKLRAVKVGRNWVTKKEWLEEYLESVKNKRNPVGISGAVLPAGGPERTEISAAGQPDVPQVLPPVRMSGFSLPSMKFPAALVLSLSVFLGVIFFNADFIKNFCATIISNFPPVQENSVSGFARGADVFVRNVNCLAEDYFLLFNKSMNDLVIKAANSFSGFGNGIAGKAKKLAEFLSGGDDEQLAFSVLDNTGKLILDREVNSLEEDIVDYTQERFDDFRTEIGVDEPESTGTVRQGMVVVPSEGDDEKTKKKIKESFSDEVEVEPIDDESGVIIPNFKEEKGDRYFYLLMPAKE